MREYERLLAGLPLSLTSLSLEGITHEVEETGESFSENATGKAQEYAGVSGLLTLADDSGLEVDALGGEPGVRSARYAGASAQDEDRYLLLLEKMVMGFILRLTSLKLLSITFVVLTAFQSLSGISM